jgi:hypothetical protein
MIPFSFMIVSFLHGWDYEIFPFGLALTRVKAAASPACRTPYATCPARTALLSYQGVGITTKVLIPYDES